MPTHAGLHLGEESTRNLASGGLSGLSIYQPGKKPGQGEFPCFLGFYACFLEIIFEACAVSVYILSYIRWLQLLVVVFTEEMPDCTVGR
jgi:hypothetical protein